MGNMKNKESAQDRPESERRDRNRVTDNQRSGHGSAQALSRLKMLERKLSPAIFPEKPVAISELVQADRRCATDKSE